MPISHRRCLYRTVVPPEAIGGKGTGAMQVRSLRPSRSTQLAWQPAQHIGRANKSCGSTRIMKCVAILLVKNLPEALRQRDIRAAQSDPYWLKPNQFCERDGGIEVIPAVVDDLIAYAGCHNLFALGSIIVGKDTDYCEYLNEGPIAQADRAFALELFQSHAHFWFCDLPWLTAVHAKS